MPGFSSIEGIISGFNTSEFVDAIIAFERRPAALMELEQTEKTNIISTFKALEAKFLALRTKGVQLAAKGTFYASTVSISDETVIEAAATGRVGVGSYDLQILSLARNHQIASQGFSDEALASFGTGTITISVGAGSAKDITIDAANNSLIGIKQAINNADAGVTATIVNDGSGSKPYRLVLTGNKTGVANSISITSDLSGGNNLNYTTASFDDPEEVLMDSSSDSAISLGATASYTGNENKVYSFTVTGTGGLIVGTDTITIEWTDGTDSGSIVVTQADTEVELVGAGSDGLKLTFSAGELTGGDKFQVTTFAPLLQEASDARIAVGSSGGTGSPITVTSESNTISDVVAGLSLKLLKETAQGEHVTISTDIDVAGIKAKINAYISAYNDINRYIDDQNSYDPDTETAGVLLGDYSVQTMQYSLRNAMASRIQGLESDYNQMYTIGIRTGYDGQLSIKDSSRLEEALRENLDDVINLFCNSGTGSTNFIEFVSAGTNNTVGEELAVDITQAATRGTFRGVSIADPAVTPLTLNSSNNRLKLSVNGVESDELVLTEKTYNSTTELVSEIQDKIDNDSRIGSRGLTVEWNELGSGYGYLELTSSTYGSGSKVAIITSISNSAFAVLGLATGARKDGLDVEGTINGEEAEGRGQYLTGKDGNDTTEDLKLKITFTSDQLVDGEEGTITLSKGIASKINDVLDSFTSAGDGMLDSRIDAVEGQVENLQERIREFDERLELRRERLYAEFLQMEEILGQLNAQSQFLSLQIVNMNANWVTGSNSSR